MNLLCLSLRDWNVFFCFIAVIATQMLLNCISILHSVFTNAISKRISACLSDISNWLPTHHLKPHLDKTELLFFSLTKSLNVLVEGHIAVASRCAKMLDVILDDLWKCSLPSYTNYSYEAQGLLETLFIDDLNKWVNHCFDPLTLLGQCLLDIPFPSVPLLTQCSVDCASLVVVYSLNFRALNIRQMFLFFWFSREEKIARFA